MLKRRICHLVLWSSLLQGGVAESTAAPPAPSPALVTATVGTAGPGHSTGFDGVVEAVLQTVLAAQVAGAAVALDVKVGDVVKAGQVLVSTRSRLDATRLGRQVGDRTTLDLLNAENDAASAELTLMQARVEFLMNRRRLAATAGRLDEAWLQSVNAALQPSQSR
jgi:multidrug efflux pump subunit AcrA (membrane-fusion protein)